MIFTIVFAIISVLLVTVILLQQKNSSLGSMVGADAQQEVATTRRGAEAFLHKVTIGLVVLFAGGAIYGMIFLS